MPGLSEALTIFGQVVSYKEQYAALLAANPTWTEGGGQPGNILLDLHQQAQAGEAWLSANGFGTAAGILASSDAAAAQAWDVGHPDLGSTLTGGPGGVPGGAGASGGPTPYLAGIRNAWAELAGWWNDGSSQAWWALDTAVRGLE